MRLMTEATREQFLLELGAYCPQCRKPLWQVNGQEQTTYRAFNRQQHHVQLEVTCKMCGTQWRERYLLFYAEDLPVCSCGLPVLDGHLTCGQAKCDEQEARYAKVTT
jgi:hypothetical protein